MLVVLILFHVWSIGRKIRRWRRRVVEAFYSVRTLRRWIIETLRAVGRIVSLGGCIWVGTLSAIHFECLAIGARVLILASIACVEEYSLPRRMEVVGIFPSLC